MVHEDPTLASLDIVKEVDAYQTDLKSTSWRQSSVLPPAPEVERRALAFSGRHKRPQSKPIRSNRWIAPGFTLAFFFSAQLLQAQSGDSLVDLNNWDLDRPIFFWSGGDRTNLAPVAGTLVQVLGRPTGSSPFQVITNLVGATVFQLFDAGLFEAGSGKVPGVKPFEWAEFYVRAWRGPTNWEAAVNDPRAFVGQSAVFADETGIYPYGGVASPIPGILRHLASFTIVPVPEICRMGIVIWPTPLCVAIQTNSANLVLRWIDLGTNYVYTLEGNASLASTNWSPVVGGPWPARTNQWVVPVSPEASRYYRVKAEKQP